VRRRLLGLLAALADVLGASATGIAASASDSTVEIYRVAVVASATSAVG